MSWDSKQWFDLLANGPISGRADCVTYHVDRGRDGRVQIKIIHHHYFDESGANLPGYWQQETLGA